MKHQSCVWICPRCRLPSFSDSFFDDYLVPTSNSFGVLATGVQDGMSQVVHGITPTTSSPANPVSAQPRAQNNSSSKIHVISVNVNGLRGKTLEMAELLQNDRPDVLICQETKVDGSVGSSELFPLATMCTAKTGIYMEVVCVLWFLVN